MIRAGIIGASGYTGGELMRLLARHPEAEVIAATSRKLAGTRVASEHRFLEGFSDLTFEDISNDEIKNMCDVIFLAVPHGTAMNYVPELLTDSKCRIIDLSADYRLDTKVFEEVYGLEHKDPRKVVFGLPELHSHEEIRNSRLVANPGCFPTGATLSAAPLAAKGLLKTVIFDSKSGVSGAGNSPSATSHFPNLTENIIPYKMTTHRHHAEMVQELSALQPGFTDVSFTPHVIPATRGILTTAHIFTTEKLSQEDVTAVYKEFYRDKKFVRVINGVPSLLSVRGSNFCHIGFEADKKSNRVVVMSAIDNLVKGASGQAVQNMNIMFGLDETTGLLEPGVF